MSLSSFSAPGGLADLSAPGLAAWSDHLDALFSGQAAGDPGDPSEPPRPQFFNPLGVDLEADRADQVMRWGAFPKRLVNDPAPGRWLAAELRDNQEEYCEWVGIRDASGTLIRVVFTTEVPSYYVLLAAVDRQRLLALYRTHVNSAARLADLIRPDGRYVPRNRWNLEGAMHMVQPNNTVPAAVILVAQSTVQRANEDGLAVANPADLIDCGVNADPARNSDPLIVGEVNSLARRGATVSLLDPVGLYIDGLDTRGWVTPDGTDSQDFWTVTRGVPGLGVRAEFVVPAERGYGIADIHAHGLPIVSPSQIAEDLSIRITGLAHGFGSVNATPRRCALSGSLSDEAEPSLAASPVEVPSLDDLLKDSSTR